MKRKVLAAIMAAAVSTVLGTASITQAADHSVYETQVTRSGAAGLPDTAPAPVEINPDAWDVPESVNVVPDPDGDGTVLTGVSIGSVWSESTAEQVQSWIEDPDSEDIVRIVDTNGEEVDPDAQVCTGMTAEVVAPDGTLLCQSSIAVVGDVIGSGELGLTQVERIARAFAGKTTLSGAYKLAADVNGDNEITATDLVQLCHKNRNNAFEVECLVANEGIDELLKAAGYDMEPWADEMAFVSASIPDDVEVSMIEWTQHDVFPDGMEQTQFSEGLERTLVFGTYSEGSTTVSTTVMTEAGKSVSREIEIVWADENDGPQVRSIG